MNDLLNRNSCAEHHEMSALIPWHVNNTLADRQLKRLHAHLAQCPACRADLELERRVHESMTTDPGVEYMPGPSLKRLQARLDAIPAGGTPTGDRRVDASASDSNLSAARGVPRGLRWTAMAASAVVIGLALGVVMIDRASRVSASRTYHTVTSPAPRVPSEVIRAVFAPTLTLVDLQALLDEAKLRIVAGPTEAGVYSLAATSDRPVTISLETLRKHPAVRFAESRVPIPEP